MMEQVMVVCWCICRKTRAGEWIMKHGLRCNECIELCFKEFKARNMEYRCEEVKPYEPPEVEEELELEVSE
jgi:hypothetical protein